MAERDDDDRRGKRGRRAEAPGDRALDSWSDFDTEARGQRGPRSWSQLAALDDEAPAPAPTERPREGLLSVDSGLLDLMALEAEGQGEGFAFGDGGALPADFDAESLADEEGGALPDDFDFATLGGDTEGGAHGALPADFAIEGGASIDTTGGGGALPDAFAIEDEAGALPDDFALPDALDADRLDDDLGGALPDDFAIGAADGALPDDFELDGGEGGALPDDFDFDEPIGSTAGSSLFESAGTVFSSPKRRPGAAPGIAELEARAGLDEMAGLADFADLDDLPDEDLESLYGGSLDDLGDFGEGSGAFPADLGVDSLIGDDATTMAPTGAGAPSPSADDIALDFDAALESDLGLDDSLHDFDGALGDAVIGGEGDDDWLAGVLDEVESRQIGGPDESWGGLLDDGPEAPGTLPGGEVAPARKPVEEDLWAAAAARWSDEPAPAAAPVRRVDDPFAAPIAGGLADQTAALGDPFATRAAPAGEGSRGAPSSPAKASPAASPVTPRGPASTAPDPAPRRAPETLAAVPSVLDERPPSGQVAITPPDPAAVAAARALLAARSAERRAALADDVASPEVMVVEEVLEDGPERRVVRVEYPRLGELEILELPEDGAELPGLDDDFEAPFGDEFVFFDEPLDPGGPSERRSALDALSREPVELAALLAADAVAEIESLGADPSGIDTPRGLASASTEAPGPIEPPRDSGADIDRALDALEVDVLDEAVPVPAPGGLAALRPGFAGVADAFDPALVDALGAPFLGVIPPFEATPLRDRFPPGSLARGRPATAADGPAIVPALPAPSVTAGEDWAHRLVHFLLAEVDAAPDRARLALVLHALGRVGWDALGDEALALDALRAAADNDPGLAINRWLLDDLLEETGRLDEIVGRALAPGPDGARTPDRLHRAGHLLLSAARDPAAALARWAEASTDDAPHGPSLLARYLVQLGRGRSREAARALDALFEGVHGAVWWSALALERARAQGEAGADPARLDLLLEEALRRRGGVPAVFAAVERHALTHGRTSLWLSALRARFDRVMADYEGGAVDEAAAQREIAEVFIKAGLALEQLGRRAEALAEYDNALRSLPDDPYVLHRAAELARRLGDHDALRGHLDRLARLSPLPGERADAAYQMGLLARVRADEATAELDFARALEALPTFTPALAALGHLDLRRGRLDAIQDRYAAEIRQFEEALRQPQQAAERRRTVRGIVDRYYRLAKLLEETGDSAVALDVYKRALAVDPGFVPALDAMDRLYVHHGRWRERAALLLGWVQRQQGSPVETIEPLLTAADTLRVHLDDETNAARVAARALAVAPDHPYALRRASETFARMGNTAARVEVELRRGRFEGDPLAPRHLLRAAELQELDGDPLAAAAEALPLYREALARDPDQPGAIDGLLRTAARLGRMGEVVAQIELHDLAAHPAPSIALPLADALLAAGRPDEAAAFLIRWRARARSGGELDRQADAAALALLSLACERTDHWRALADTLEERAQMSAGPARAALLARVGMLWELRLGEPALAEDAYRRALAADPQLTAARAGLARLDLGEPDDWQPPERAALAAARAADRDGERAARSAALDRLAAEARDPRDVVAWRLLARGDETSVEAAGALYAAHPERGDHYLRYRRRLEAAGDRPSLLAAAWSRLDHEDEPGRVALLTRLIGDGLRHDDPETVRRAAEALLAHDPQALPALLALRRLARREGRAAGEVDTRLTGTLRAPAPAAALHHATALEAEARGADPDRVRGLLTQAVELNPADPVVAAALADRLTAAGEFSRLAELYRRRLEALAEPRDRRPVARALAALQAERFADLAAAYATLRRELDAEAPDVDTALAAADYAERLGRTDEADRCHAEAAGAEGGRVPATRARAAALYRRGDPDGARALLDVLLAHDPRDLPALSLLAEILAAERQWKGVVQVFRRLMNLEAEPAARADRAMAIAEIFARVYHDPRRAAGWFKRAVELDPQRDRAITRLLEEAARAPTGAVPVEHLRDALDRAVDAWRQRFAERPTDPAPLHVLARLHARRGDRDAQLVVGELLWWLGAADDKLRAWVGQARERVQLDFARPLSDELRRTHLEHPGERGPARLVFDAFALVLTEVLTSAMPAGVPRLSRRSFAEWQAEFRRLAAGLGVDDVELWNGGRGLTEPRALYLPQPAIAVPAAWLDGPLDAPQAFALAHHLEGLRAGRLLLEDPGPDRIGRCTWVMTAALAADEAPPDELPAGLHRRLVDRARRLPRRIKLQLDALAEQANEPLDFGALAAAAAATRARAGLLCCGDTRVALDALVFEDATAADAARRAGGVPAALGASPAGRALAIYALGPDFSRLREVLGLGLSRRVG
ncbi:MAG: hypothetical protein R3F65_22865 [bacterium]